MYPEDEDENLYLSEGERVAMIRTPGTRKLLMAVIMLHYAALLNAMSNVFAYLILKERYLEMINAECGSLTFDLYLLASTVMTWPLVWYFLRHILRKNLPAFADHQFQRHHG